jgi:hypothetical protein
MESVVYALSLPIATTYALTLTLAVLGFLQLVGLRAFRELCLRWGYSARLSRVIGALDLLTAILFASSHARLVAVLLTAAVNFVAVVLLLKNRAYLLALPGMTVMAALPLTLLRVY